MNVPKRGTPNEKRQALGAGPVGPGPILLVDNYVAYTATDMSSNPADPLQMPINLSYGGNFAYYIQHKVVGNIPDTGALHGGVRAQVESHAIGNPKAPVNDPVAFYGGVYNGGTGLGAFGAHVDAYHAGTAIGRHSTYGISAEIWKMIPGGIAAGYVARSQDKYPVDYGLALLNVGQNVGFKRGIQLGTPVFEHGGIVGSAGQVVNFDVGIDLSWGAFKHAAMQVPADSWISLAGYPQAQDAVPITHCRYRWNSATGNYEIRFGDALRFGVNMTNGMLFLSNKSLDAQNRFKVMVQGDDGSMRQGHIKVEF